MKSRLLWKPATWPQPIFPIWRRPLLEGLPCLRFSSMSMRPNWHTQTKKSMPRQRMPTLPSCSAYLAAPRCCAFARSSIQPRARLRFTSSVSTARNGTRCLFDASARTLWPPAREQEAPMHLRVAIILASLIALPSASNQATPPQSQASGFVNTLMPQPSQLSAQEGRLTLTPSFAAAADHYRDARLDAAIARTLDRLKTQTGISI